MDLTIYDIIQGPVITDKAYKLNKVLKQLVLKIHPDANKTMVKEALFKLFNVKVKTVRISNRKGKNRQFKRMAIQGPAMKKAIVTLAPGYSLDMFEQAGGQESVEQSANS